LFYFDALQITANHAEQRPQESGMENSPILRIGAHFTYRAKYFGFDWNTTRRKLELDVSMSEACRDNQLIKSFFNWERSQAGLPVIARKWRAELIATKELIGARP